MEMGWQGLQLYGDLHMLENRMRNYWPVAHRFTQSDPFAFLAPSFSATQHYHDGLSSYTYTSQNPVARVDPLGLFYCRCTGPTTCGMWHPNGPGGTIEETRNVHCVDGANCRVRSQVYRPCRRFCMCPGIDFSIAIPLPWPPLIPFPFPWPAPPVAPGGIAVTPGICAWREETLQRGPWSPWRAGTCCGGRCLDLGPVPGMPPPC